MSDFNEQIEAALQVLARLEPDTSNMLQGDRARFEAGYWRGLTLGMLIGMTHPQTEIDDTSGPVEFGNIDRNPSPFWQNGVHEETAHDGD